MTDIRARLADALREHLICDCGAWAEDMGESCDHLADVLLSLPGIAIVDLSNVDPIAKGMAQNWPDTYAHAWPWSDIPERDREAYRQQARDALRETA